jgi:hypothetical protein
MVSQVVKIAVKMAQKENFPLPEDSMLYMSVRQLTAR